MNDSRTVTIRKIGNRTEAERYNQAIKYAMTGRIKGGDVVIGKSLTVTSITGEWLSTSLVRSILHVKEESGYDKLVLPKDFPNSSSIELPELKEGDILIATMNSVYLITDADCSIRNEY